jgi:hypothetical protein
LQVPKTTHISLKGRSITPFFYKKNNLCPKIVFCNLGNEAWEIEDAIDKIVFISGNMDRISRSGNVVLKNYKFYVAVYLNVVNFGVLFDY